MPALPPPSDLNASVDDLVHALAGHLGTRATVEVCIDLLRGADRREHADALRYLAGRSFGGGDVPDPDSWKDFWLRTWGARGLLHLWDDTATQAVVDGLDDDEWRPAEMCLKVAARHEVGGAGDGAAQLTMHELPRVRAQALRALAVVGDTEHVNAVRAALDDEDAEVRRHAARAMEQLEKRLDLS